MSSSYRNAHSRLTAVALVAACTAASLANLLADPGFEDPNIPLVPIGQVAGPPFLPGAWGVESASKTGPLHGISPFQGNYMLHMDRIVGNHTQTIQAVDLTAYAADIDAGNGTFTFSAWYNAPSGSSARAIATIQSYDSDNTMWIYPTDTQASSLNLDTDLDTWEQVTVSMDLPVGTRWVIVQVHFTNDSLTAAGGFVDGVTAVIPEPASLGLLGMGALLLLRRR